MLPVTRINERNTIDPEHVMLALTMLRDFMVERGIMEVSTPVYEPIRGKLSPRELYVILHVVFAETEIMVHLHKKEFRADNGGLELGTLGSRFRQQFHKFRVNTCATCNL